MYIIKGEARRYGLGAWCKKSGNASQSQGISFLNVFSLFFFFFQTYLSKTGPTCRQKPLAIFLDGLFKSELELKISQKIKKIRILADFFHSSTPKTTFGMTSPLPPETSPWPHGSIPLITGEGVLGTFGWQEIDPRGEMWKWTRIVATAARASSLTLFLLEISLGTKVRIGFVRCFFWFLHMQLFECCPVLGSGWAFCW